MYYTGIDLHKYNSYLTSRDETEKIVQQLRIENDETILINSTAVNYFSGLRPK